jgi:hypothetical protein
MARGGGIGGAAGLNPVTRRGGRGKPAAAHQLRRGRRCGGSALTGRRRRWRARSDRTVTTRRRGTALTGDGVGRCRLGDAEEEERSGRPLELSNGARRLRTGFNGGRVLHPLQTVQQALRGLQVDDDAR